MADAATQQLIDQIVQERVQAGAMFTAYDITLEARRRGGNVRHNDVRDLVHEFFEQGRMGAAYKRSTVDVGAPTRPFLYHRFDADTRSYQPPPAGAPTAGPTGSTPGGPTPATPPQTGFLGRLVQSIFGGSNPAPPPGPANNPQFVPPGPPSPPMAPGSRPPMGSGNPPRKSDSPPRKSTTLGLDAAHFLPITRSDLVQAAKGIRLWSGVFWGRRDLIPPVDDPRTSLIDRGMVTQGLLSPEQLADIHRVGAEMDLVRPDLTAVKHQAQQSGQAAVDADREERAKLKAQKKAEAAERKKARAEQIASRKANDIIFLGRGVSVHLADRASDTSRLTALQLPILSTPADIAKVLGLTIPQLRGLAFHTEVANRIHYVQFTVPKKSGGTRTLSAPHRRLAAAQQWILQNILNKLPVEAEAHGFVGGRSIVTNAQAHVGKAVVVNMDLEGFFPSITFQRVRSVFHRQGYSPAVATILALLCTECPRRNVEFAGQSLFVATGPRGLPQGACTSPALSNQVARRLDKRLQGLARKLELTYTRYADDITFSGDAELKDRVGYVMARVRHIAQDEGFAVNEAKSRVLRRNTAQTVTGLVVNDRVSVPRSEIRRLRAILHQAKKTGLEAQNRQDHSNFRGWVEGMIAFIAMSRPDVAAQLRQQLSTVN